MTGSYDHTIKICDVRDGKNPQKLEFNIHTDLETGIWHPNSEHVAYISCDDGTVYGFDCR